MKTRFQISKTFALAAALATGSTAVALQPAKAQERSMHSYRHGNSFYRYDDRSQWRQEYGNGRGVIPDSSSGGY